MTSESLTTLAEQSNFRQTGRIEEVERLSHALALTWPEAVRSFEYGRSVEGRPLRALVISRTGALTAAEIRAQKIPLLMIQGGIHPGESDGKDAGFIAMRELLQGVAAPRVLQGPGLVAEGGAAREGTSARGAVVHGVAAPEDTGARGAVAAGTNVSGLLDKIAILFVPAFNADGHERTGRWNRPNQVGPEETGWRTTAQNLNLNRDYTKADTPEMRAMLRLIDSWDPLVCADLHVTDGADFEPDVSIQVEPINQGDSGLRATGLQLRDQLIAKLSAAGSIPLDFYPDFAVTDDPSSGFALTVFSPRFSTGYFAQRNRFTVLVETHSWKEYAHRVRVTRNTIVGLAELVAAHGAEWLKLCRRADDAATGLGGQEVALDYLTGWREPAKAGAATPERDNTEARVIEFRGYAYTRKPSPISGGLVTVYDPRTPQIWRVPMRDTVKPSVVARVPGAGYVVQVGFSAEIAARLEAHGIGFETVRERLTGLRVSTFRARQVNFSTSSRARCLFPLHSLWRGSSSHCSSRRRPTPSPRGAFSTPASSRRSRSSLMWRSRSRPRCSTEMRSSERISTPASRPIRHLPTARASDWNSSCAGMPPGTSATTCIR
jgi:murein tripeptide amidase MpaA